MPQPQFLIRTFLSALCLFTLYIVVLALLEFDCPWKAYFHSYLTSTLLIWCQSCYSRFQLSLLSYCHYTLLKSFPQSTFPFLIILSCYSCVFQFLVLWPSVLLYSPFHILSLYVCHVPRVSNPLLVLFCTCHFSYTMCFCPTAALEFTLILSSDITVDPGKICGFLLCSKYLGN